MLADTNIFGSPAGVNWAGLSFRDYDAYAPFYFTSNGTFTALPLAYALILFNEAVGNNGMVLDYPYEHETMGNTKRIKVWAVVHPDKTVKLVIVNKGDKPTKVYLHLKNRRRAGFAVFLTAYK